jgi:peptide/nickel transport system substrate-binding protein
MTNPLPNVSRRRFLQIGAGAGGALLLAACGSSGGTTTSTAATGSAGSGSASGSTAAGAAIASGKNVSSTTDPTTTAPGGVALADKQEATFAISNLPATVDPHVTNSLPRRFDVYECLTDPDPVTGEPRPFLATSWKQVDATTWEFTLRTDVKFHDGSALTADDVAFSTMRATGDAYGVKSQVNTIKSATAVNPTTVRIVTKTADLLLPKRVGQYGIIPKAYYQGLGADDKARDAAFLLKPIGSGPFKVVSYSSEKGEFVKADTTWRKPTLTKLTVLSVTDTGSQLNSLLSGDVQYVNLMPLTSVTPMQAGGATIISITKGNDLGAFMDEVDMNGQLKTGPMGNPKVRQAFQYAINKEELVGTVLKGATYNDNGQLIGPGLTGFNAALKQFAYDPEKAKKMLDDAGYPVPSGGGPRFTITMASAFAGPGSVRRLVGEYMANAITQLGVQVDYTAITDNTLASAYFADTKQRPDIYHFGLFTRPYMDAARAYNYFTSTGTGKHMSDPEFDKLYALQLTQTDVAARAKTLDRMGEIMQEKSCFLFNSGDVWIDAAGKNLQGLTQCDATTDQYYSALYVTK